ncbi:MAG: hypothetical protein SGJ17_12350 [Hyphomicrobiales bacterium]|nr:hypothetical protein [Hyphomicrobiales bacterium]
MTKIVVSSTGFALWLGSYDKPTLRKAALANSFFTRDGASGF